MNFKNVSEDFLLVLDAHGVVFNNPLRSFIKQLSENSDISPEEMWTNWRNQYRTQFWEGDLSIEALWSEFTPNEDPLKLEKDLLSRYSPGPLYDELIASDRSVCLFSNHRSEWLLPRLKKFHLEKRFDHIIVSDKIKAAKPSKKAFDALVEITGTNKLFLIDDSRYNIEAAISFGIEAQLPEYSADVDRNTQWHKE